MADTEVTVKSCTCASCEVYKINGSPTSREEFTFTTQKKDFKFPTVVNPTPEKGSNYAVIIAVFQDQRLSASDKLRDAGDIIWHLTYVDVIKKEVSIPDYVDLCDYLLDVNMDAVIQDDKLAADFLRRIASFFVMTWYSFAVAGDKKAEWVARRFRKLLTHMLEFTVICRQVKKVFCSPEYWPVVSPLDMFDNLCKHHLFCLETLSLLVNFTRIESMCSEIQKNTECLKHIQEQYQRCCDRIRGSEESGGLMLLLFMNMTCTPEFLQFLVEGNNGYFMNVILADLISNPCNYSGVRASAWPFLRNLSLLEKGREQIIKHLELYLGHVLFPIAGPEVLTDEECENLPLDVQLLPETKTRVENRRIRECILDILYSLCRYKKDRIKLREANVYHILKHYHKVETDEILLEKLENVVNVLIRHEGSEIEVDDLLEGLKLEDKETIKTFTPTLPLSPMNRTHNLPFQFSEPVRRTDIKEGNLKMNRLIVCADDDDDEIENPCTSEFIEQEIPNFCYFKAQEFHRLRKLLYHVQKEIRGKKPPSKLSDEFIKKKFFELYGPVNYDDPFMQARWKTVTETINEIKIQPESCDIKTQLLDEHIEVNDDDLTDVVKSLDEAIDLIGGTTEQCNYKTFNPHVGDGDWFILPRPDLSLIRQQYFPDSDETSEQQINPQPMSSLSALSQHTISSSVIALEKSDFSSSQNVDSNQSEKTIKPLKNLHVYDPKFEFCFKPPYLILRREIETIEVPKLQSVRILEHINRFPLGVSADMFWEKFYKVHDYLPRLTDVPSLDKLISLYDQEIYFVKASDKLPTLLFPSVLEGVVHPEQILKRVWHLVRCVFGSQSCPWLFTESLLDELKRRYNLVFDPLDWDFPNVNDFLTFCIQKFGCVELFEVYRQNYTEQHVSKFKDFLVINSEFLKDQIAALYGVSETTAQRKKLQTPMPQNVVKSDTEVDLVTNHLTVGTTYDLDIKTIHKHNLMSCVLITEYDDLWEFHESLQEGPLLFKFDRERQPDPNHLTHGTFVMAYCRFKKCKLEAKWYRAKVLFKHPTKSKYLVYGIDFGFMQYLELKDLRYMPNDEIPDHPAQSVPIELIVQNPCSEDWNKDVSLNAFTKLLKDFDYLRATFIEGKFDDVLGCKKWVVTAYLYANTNKRRYIRDFALVFQEEYKRKVELRRKRKENTKNGSKSKEGEDKPGMPDASISTN